MNLQHGTPPIAGGVFHLNIGQNLTLQHLVDIYGQGRAYADTILHTMPIVPTSNALRYFEAIEVALVDLTAKVKDLEATVAALQANTGDRMATGTPTLLTFKEVAERLRIDARTVRRWQASGRVQVVRIGSRVMIREDVVDAIIQHGLTNNRQKIRKAA